MGFCDYDGVLLDLDGTILDSMSHHAQTWQQVLLAEGLEVDLAFIYENEGCLDVPSLAELIRVQGRSLAPGETPRDIMGRMLARQLDIYMQSHVHRVRAFPQTMPFLEGLRRVGLPLALVTSSRRPMLEKALPAWLLDSFSVILTADDTRRHKPHPEPYLTAADALGLSATRCLVVENAPAGIAAAHAAGATCFAVATTLPAARLRETQAKAVFPNLKDIALHLEIEWKEPGGEG